MRRGSRSNLSEWLAFCFGNPEPAEGGYDEGGPRGCECGTEAVLLGHSSNGEGSGSTCDAAYVISKALRCGADSSLVELCCHRGEARVVAGSEEGHQGAKRDEQPRSVHPRIREHEQRGHDEIKDVADLAPECVAQEPEADIAEPHAKLHGDYRGGHCLY